MTISQIQIKSFQHLLAKRQDVMSANTLPVGPPDAAVYYFFKQPAFLSKKQQHWHFYFFQGLNTNPQNLSIYLRDEAQRENKHSKEKLIKGIFMVYDLFSKSDLVVEINIPGNLRIYKVVNGQKELVSNQEIDLMYLSSVFRSMYQVNLPWGRFYHLFHDSKNYAQELKNFYSILFRCLLKKDVTLSNQYQSFALVKGSHACSIVLQHMKDRRLVRHSIEIIQDLFSKHKQYKQCYKYAILLAQMYVEIGKIAKGLQLVCQLKSKFPNEPYLLYYQAKYLNSLSYSAQALTLANSIVQYNQFQVWILLAQIHLQLKNYNQLLICLNHSVKLSKLKTQKNIDIIYRAFQQLGKIKLVSAADGIEYHPKLLISNENPLSILVKEVEQKNKFLVEKAFWKLNCNQKIIYGLLQQVRYRLDMKKFQELLMNTFEDTIKKTQPISIRKGIVEAGDTSQETNQKLIQDRPNSVRDQESDQLPDFLKNSSEQIDQSVTLKPARNLSIIPEIESVIENSNYEQREKEKYHKGVKLKRQVQQGLFKLVQMLLAQTDFQKAEYENNVAKILNVYNKMRTSSKFNNYYADRMFKIFVQTANYRSIIVMTAQTLDFLEQRGVKKIDKLPYWMHKYLFFIIEERGLKFLNDMLEKLNFYDEAVIDSIQIAKSWKMKGITY